MNELILENLKKYLDGETTLRQFYSWLVSETWDRENELVNSIKLRLHEHSSCHWTEGDLKKLLGEIFLLWSNKWK